MLALEIEFLREVAVAASAWDRAAPEWPPHPDRLFSALVAAWAETGKPEAGRAALQWLETLPPPVIHAAEAETRTVADHYVPPNDMTVTGKPGSAIPADAAGNLAVLPALRKNRQPRQFPAVIPADPRVRFLWPEVEAPAAHAAALRALMAELTYLGHSSSMVRGALLDSAAEPEPEAEGALRTWTPDAAGGDMPLRVPYPGRLADLEAGHAAMAHAEAPFRPPPGPTAAYRAPDADPAEPPPAPVFGANWIVLADAGGDAPDLVAFPAVAARLRDALLAASPNPPPEVLSGHLPDGTPSRAPHLAILPLADIGWRYSRGRLLGAALVLPRGQDGRGEPARQAVMRALARLRDPERDNHVALKLGPLGVWCLSLKPEPDLRSLEPGRYLRAARRWASVTPVVLDRHPKDKPGERVGELIARACENIGLPAPLAVELHKHAGPRGAPSRDAVRLPPESKLADRPRHHVVLHFAAPVQGPVAIGAGRFRGLGLCLPWEDRQG